MSNPAHDPLGNVVGLAEREVALRAARGVLDAAGSGDGSMLVLLGEPGMGKSALLDSTMRMAGTEFDVRWARGSVSETDLPFAYAEQLLGPLTSEEALGSSVSEPLARRALVHSQLRRRMRDRASARPLLLLLDDLQWADPDSVGAVAYLARRTSGLPVAMVGAVRPWPRAALESLRVLEHEGSARVESLTPLSLEGCARVLGLLLGRVLPHDVVDDVWHLSGGVPLLLGEAAAQMKEEGALPPRPSREVGEIGEHRSVLLLSALASVPAETIDALRAVAILGSPANTRLARHVADKDEETFAAALDVALEAGVLWDAGGGSVSFRHEMLADAVAHDVPPGLGRLFHARAFDLLVEGAQFGAAVPHALPAGLHGDRRAVDAVRRAAAEAMRDGAVNTCLAHLDVARELAAPNPPVALLEQRADALLLANHPIAARDLYRQVVQRNTGEPDLATLAKLLQSSAYAGELDEALESYDRLILREEALGREPVSLLIERAHVIWEVEGPRRALKSLEFIDESKLSYEERELLEVARGSNLFQTGDLTMVAAAERRASATLNALESGRGLDLASSSNAILIHATNCGALERFDASERVVERGLEFFGRSGALLAMAPLYISRLGVLLHRGALVETVAGVDDIEEEMELGPLLTPYVMSFKVRALVAMGRLEDARRTEDAVLALPGSHAWYVRLGLEMARGQSLAMRGRLDDACWMYDGIEATVASVGLEQPCILPWVGEAIDVALLAGRVEDAERRVEWLDARRTVEMGVWPRMVALAGRAGVAAARGDREAADEGYARALAEASLFELERARIALRYGTWLRHHGAAVRARPWLAEALTIAESRGAAPLADEARLELSAAGGRRRRRTGADELTTQQARVAALAATGATNREIAAYLHISPRTVESHLAAALLKLNLRTRTELRQRRRELGLVKG